MFHGLRHFYLIFSFCEKLNIFMVVGNSKKIFSFEPSPNPLFLILAIPFINFPFFTRKSVILYSFACFIIVHLFHVPDILFSSVLRPRWVLLLSTSSCTKNCFRYRTWCLAPTSSVFMVTTGSNQSGEIFSVNNTQD